jgi:hypothetical protein
MRPEKVPDGNRLEYALAYLLASTRRSRRKTELVEIARQIAIARELLGSLKSVAGHLGLSGEMIREFASVDKLSPPVKDLIRRGMITSVDVAYRLSLLGPADQLSVAKDYVAGRLSSNELKTVVSFKRQAPSHPIGELVNQVSKTRPIRRYLVRFACPQEERRSTRLVTRFSKVIGSENVVDLREGPSVCTLVISRKGEERLREEAHARGVTKRRLVAQIIHGE